MDESRSSESLTLLRGDLLTLRKHISKDQRLSLNDGIVQRLSEFIFDSSVLHHSDERPGKIAVYSALATEPDLSAFFDAAKKRGYQLFLPRVTLLGQPLEFAPWKDQSELVMSSFGVLEPKAEATDSFSLDLIVMPCLGFWKTGYRLGYGGGFYDRTLAKLRGNSEVKRNSLTSRPFTIGVAFDELEIMDALKDLHQPKPHDEPLHAIVTPSKLYLFADAAKAKV